MKFGVFLLTVALCACDGTPDPATGASDLNGPDPVATTSQPSADGDVVAGINDFAGRLYVRLDEGSPAGENIFFSPFSIETAFGILAIGARGETDAQIRNVLGLPGGTAAHDALGELSRGLVSDGKNGAPQLKIANALWLQRDFPIEAAYRDEARRAYGAPAVNLDFLNGREDAAARINNWAAENTNNRIKSIVSAQSLDPATVLVITNAIYFLGKWQMEFSPSLTQQQPFALGGGGTADVPLMYREKHVRYVETDGYQAVDLPYRESEMVMSVILPSPDSDLDAVEDRIVAGELSTALAALDNISARDVHVYLPKLEIETDYDLIPPLQSMGLTLPFGNSANLRGIADADLAVDAALHKAFLKVDESGTEAAAVTALAVVEVSAAIDPTPTFRADRPFLFAIRDSATSTILFLGRISDPRTKG